MAEIIEALNELYRGLGETMKTCGFTPVFPAGADRSEAPVTQEGDKYVVAYTGENKALRLEFANDRLMVMGAQKEGEILAGDFSEVLKKLFVPGEATEKSLRSDVNEISEEVLVVFGPKAQKSAKSKLPQPVSKAAAKSGAVSYDPNTLGNRFTSIYKELREEYKRNCETYGQFLPEDFFLNHGNAVVLGIIRENNPTKMRQLFNLLNEIYEDGTNETQSLIAVTILGALGNDDQLLANCVDYMSDDMTKPVINVNRYLDSKGGAGAKMKLENPPKYKPKKQRKKSFPGSSLGM
ncbi:MAG: hypothetical protein IK080_05130 [Clostridia bacterium]|nr:hypothetical protein [Clostridia bacterium]